MTYTNFMTQLALDCNLDTSSTTQWTTFVRSRLTQFLNEGMEQLWQGSNNRIWPWLQDYSDVTVASGVVLWSDLNSSPAFTLWTSDPRTQFTGSSSSTVGAEPVPWALEPSGDTVLAQTTASSVMAIYSIARPVFTTSSSTEVVPDKAVRWMLAFIALRNMENSMPSNAEQLLQRAIAREEREWNAMVVEATQTWCKAPWLDWFATYNP